MLPVSMRLNHLNHLQSCFFLIPTQITVTNKMGLLCGCLRTPLSL
jgi:hypothetical protein